MYLEFRFSKRQVFSKYLDFSSFDRLPLSLPFGVAGLSLEVLASCNGLLLLIKDLRTYVLWNPSTGAFREFLGLHQNMSIGSYCRLYGIAYNATTDTYKIISASQFGNSREETIFTIHDCSTWTTINQTGGFLYYITRNQQAANVNGTPHWLVSHELDSGCVIICYDMLYEKFEEVPKPEWADDVTVLELKAHKGMLCLIHYKRGFADVWVMERYGKQESWTKLYPYVACSSDFGVRPLGVTHGDHVVMEVEQRKLEVYDPRNRVFSMKNSYTYPNSGFGAITYVETLVSPVG
ncbi:Unknown protein [Striga hermonthica]|uniref:F-box associated beta-propeller type 1 domain-containing protein n=1 Tax=Striga hermonthica TaxID=68872 RepID=A0A9N7MI94_STRHE|nr:Unknown protein [Striga hermonthica]